MKLILQAIKSLFRKLERNLEKSIQKVQNDIDGTKASIVQSDFAQNDASQLDYVKNRTHWSEGTGEVLYDGTITLNNNTTVQPDKYFTLEAGRSYTVIYNDDVYECKADANTNGVAIGTEDFSDLPIRIITTDMDGRLITYLITPFSTGSYKLKLIDGILHKIDPKYLPEAPTTLPNPNALTINGTSYDGSAPVDISIEAGEASSPDWNAAEGETGHILNRTHYDTRVEVSILDNTTIEFNDDNWGFVYLPAQTILEIGKTYKVIWDGIEYECVGVKYSGGIAVGDNNFEEFPFYILCYIKDEEFEISSLDSWEIDGSGKVFTHTVSISGNDGELKKLAQKYVPNSDWNASEGEDGYIENRTHYEYTGWGVLLETSVTTTESKNYAPINFTLEVGKKYTIELDGVTYNELVAFDDDGACIGEVYDYEADDYMWTEYPFAIYNVSSSKSRIYIQTAGDHTLQIYGDGVAHVHKLDAKYLPDGTLTFTGSVTDTYDGFTDKTVNIPYGFSDTNVTESFIKILLEGSYETEQRYNIHTLAGKMGLKSGIIKESADEWYYYEFGEKVYPGLIIIDGDYYYVNSFYKVVRDSTYYVSKTNGYVENGNYYFDKDGKMNTNRMTININNLVDGIAVPIGTESAGQFTSYNRTLSMYSIVNNITITMGGEDITETSYNYDSKTITINSVTDDVIVNVDGFYLNGIIKETEDTWYYYVDGVKTYAGLVVIDGDYYYVSTKGDVKHDCKYWVSKNNGYIPNAMYVFDETGAMVSKLYDITITVPEVITHDYPYQKVAGKDGADKIHTITLTASEGYTISSVTVTMGEEDITSTAYADGIVTITNPTGDIVITAIAEPTT